VGWRTGRAQRHWGFEARAGRFAWFGLIWVSGLTWTEAAGTVRRVLGLAGMPLVGPHQACTRTCAFRVDLQGCSR